MIGKYIERNLNKSMKSSNVKSHHMIVKNEITGFELQLSLVDHNKLCCTILAEDL